MYKKAVAGKDACMLLAYIIGPMVLWKTFSKNWHHDTLNVLSAWNPISDYQAIQQQWDKLDQSTPSNLTSEYIDQVKRSFIEFLESDIKFYDYYSSGNLN